jgi:hypothetical protein
MRQISDDSQSVIKSENVEAGEGGYCNDPSRDSFSDADDDEIAAALASRIEGGEREPEANSAADGGYLTGTTDLLLHAYAMFFQNGLAGLRPCPLHSLPVPAVRLLMLQSATL